ncbi:MAG: hypothetical protein Q4D51_04235 [Eubacteriales bacterium]|nr:hypothetical protein [Eubacteriales bacterium]
MNKRIYEYISKNYALIIALVTSVTAVMYAILRLIVYIFWSGYFKALNIDFSMLNINYEGYVFYSILFGAVLIEISYLMWVCYEFSRKSIGATIKIFGKVTKFVLSLVFSAFALSLGNYPFSLILSILLHTKMNFKVTIVYLITLYIMEEILLCITVLERKGKDNSIKHFIGIVILIIPVFLGMIYYAGGNKLEISKQIMLTRDKKYAMVYCDNDVYLLKPAKMHDDKLYIDIDEQKIVDLKETDLVIYEGEIVLE